MKVFCKLLIALAIGTGAAHSALISLDSPFGPDTITRDTSTGLDWLDNNLTALMQSPDLDILLATDPLYSGFRYARSAEVHDFIAPFLIPHATLPGFLEAAPLQALIDLIGSGGGSYGPEGDQIWSIRLSVFPPPPVPHAEIDEQLGNFPVVDSTPLGYFLVRPIPEPSTFLYIGSVVALCALLLGRGRRATFPSLRLHRPR